jgi:hypothetical protein
MQHDEVDRIARTALRELGVGTAGVTVSAEPQPGRWRIDVATAPPCTIVVRASAGTSAQFIRDQIFEQFQRR